MLSFFVKRPVTTIMFVLFWVVLGLYSLPKMNIERTPPMDLPLVTATFVYPGAAPAEMESQVIEKAEDAINEISVPSPPIIIAPKSVVLSWPNLTWA